MTSNELLPVVPLAGRQSPWDYLDTDTSQFFFLDFFLGPTTRAVFTGGILTLTIVSTYCRTAYYTSKRSKQMKAYTVLANDQANYFIILTLKSFEVFFFNGTSPSVDPKSLHIV